MQRHRTGYFAGVVQGFVATSLTQIFRNGFLVMRLRQQVNGSQLKDEVLRIWQEFPSGWLRGNVAQISRNLISSVAMVL